MIINPYVFAVTIGGGGGADLTADAHWLFDDGSGSTAADGSGNGKTLTLYEAPTWATGPNSDGCVVFASNSYGAVPGDSAFANFTSGDFTLTAWVNPSSLANDPVLFFKGEYGAGGYYVQLMSTGVVRYNVGAIQLESPAGAVSTATWSHIAITKTGTTVKIYVNGAEIQTGSVSAPTASSDDFKIGRYAGFASYDLVGSVDDARVYSSLKSGAEISAIYLSTGGAFSPAILSPDIWLDDTGADTSVWSDISGNARHATQATGALQPAIISAAIDGKQDRRFNNAGGTHYVLADFSAAQEDVTIFFVAQRTTTNVFVNYQRVLSAWDGGSNPDYVGGISGIMQQDLDDAGTGYVVRPAHVTVADLPSVWCLNPKIGINANGTAEAFEGDIAELIVFFRTLSAGEKADVTTWLTNKWLTVPTQVVTNGPFGTLRDDYGGWVGFSFSIASSQTITALSKWSPSESNASVNVKLWTNDGTELASVTIDDSTGSDEWLDVSITPLVLSPGTYRIAAFNNSHFHDADTSYILAPGFTKVDSIYGGGAYADTSNGAGSVYGPVGFIFNG